MASMTTQINVRGDCWTMPDVLRMFLVALGVKEGLLVYRPPLHDGIRMGAVR